MKKGVEIAFAIALFILAIISTVWTTELMANIIYAVVIPSFILSLISFATEISALCEEDAEKTTEVKRRLAEVENQLADAQMASYNAGSYELPYKEGFVPKEIHKHKKESLIQINEALISHDVQMFCIKCKKVCGKISVVGYVILFLSLSLSPYIVKLLSIVDLNCITLWSLALLYVSLELKSEFCSWLYHFLYNKYKKKPDRVLNLVEEEDC